MPLAVDTNVLAGALVDDGSAQARVARELLVEQEVLILDTVLLETEWILRSQFKLGRSAVNDLFSGLLSAINASFEDRQEVMNVILAHRAGLDFADAIHLFAAKECEAMVTFDENLIRRSRNVEGAVKVRKP